MPNRLGVIRGGRQTTHQLPTSMTTTTMMLMMMVRFGNLFLLCNGKIVYSTPTDYYSVATIEISLKAAESHFSDKADVLRPRNKRVKQRVREM